MRLKCACLAMLLLAVPAIAQDSVGIPECLPGDATAPWDDSSATNGSEQCDDYVIDLYEFQSGWGSSFGIAPLVKSSKTSSGFFGSLISANGISRTHKQSVPFPASSYDLWTASGFGVNNDANLNTPGTPTVPPAVGNQFALAFAEFSTTDSAVNYNGVIGAMVNYDPSDPNRLYVSKRVVATNGCNDAANTSSLTMGSVDSGGSVAIRADENAATGGCGLVNLAADNVFLIDAAARDCEELNVVDNSFDTTGGLFDLGATQWLVRNDPVGFSLLSPGIIPGDVVGGDPVFFGLNTDALYYHGDSFPPAEETAGTAGNPLFGIGGGYDQTRGTVSYGVGDCSFLSSSAGVAGVLANAADTDGILVWGVDSTGDVTGRLLLVLPASLTDPIDTFDTSSQGVVRNEFTNYHGGTVFQGGNGQVALGYDQDGRLLVAAAVTYNAGEVGCAGDDCPNGYIAVARVDCSDGSAEWTLAAWNGGDIVGLTPPVIGKPLKDGAGGNVTGRLGMLYENTGGAPFGPSFSSPMIDSVGNVYFTGTVKRYFNPIECDTDVDCAMINGCNTAATGLSGFCHDGFCESCDALEGNCEPCGDLDTGLVRAVYDPDQFGYELDLLVDAGQGFVGQNSDLFYRITFMGTATGPNDIDPGTTFSQAISQAAFAGADPSGLSTADPHALGGLVFRANIIYDSDENMDIGDCTTDPKNPGDQEYNFLMYLSGVVSEEVPCTTIADCGDQNNDGFRDDVCLHYACVDGACVETPRGVGQSDMGGSFGACDNDGTCDGNDRFLALGCFGDDWPGDPCEPAPPAAINVDAGGAFGSCDLDGVCDGNDAFAALNCFGGDMACPCGGGPAPEAPTSVEVVDTTGVSLRASSNVARPGDLISVDVYFDDAVSDLRGYQLHLATVGGKRGQLELVDIAVEQRKDAALAADWQAFNMSKSQMVAGMDSEGVATAGAAYLATFTYRVSRDAVGAFSIDLLHDNTDPGQRTFLFPTPSRAKIAVSGTSAARVEVRPVRQARR